ncbi:CPBP family intramembrane glutamic endopeptidase [Protaetiibacter larvae]|uniref:CPBP family intramembrane metalloprotease n=1 Tax=Protaetiibacter larvae TaxID=2592654 RepID=A0A5C1Y926_9MICO|nr:CPBP family intramembrane glutamic endopeptidase [Protaetiibacter larvae]QEO10266.1 CPBP family intramembrane metalloprotease [Protaetiibacter larvae]
MSTGLPAATPYHRLFRTSAGYAWWRPLAAAGLLVVFTGVASVVLAVLWMAAALISGDVDLEILRSPAALTAHLTDVSNPLSLLFLLANLAVLLPLVPLSLLCVGLRPLGMRHSVAFRVRWRWMLACVVPALVVTLVSIGVSFVPALFGQPLPAPVPVEAGRLVVLLILVVLLAPLQSAAEEYIFRGLAMQAIGAWVRPVWVAIVVSTVIFTAGHVQYELWGMLSVAVMGAGFAIVTWRTGGLEAAIALHVINNVLSLGLLTTGLLGTTQMSSEGSTPLTPLLQAVFTAGYLLWVDRLAARRGLVRQRPVETPVQPLVG